MTTLDRLYEQGILTPLDLHLARTLARLGNETREQVMLAVALLSRHVAAGNVCLDLDAPDAEAMLGTAVEPRPRPSDWPALLASSALVADTASTAVTPLVLSGSRLYLRRHWEDECTLADDLRARAGAARPVDADRLRTTLETLLPSIPPPDAPDWQRVAAFLALRRRLCVITGGPGTGKTTTVVVIAALAIDQAHAHGARLPRIALCAPTGKAAGRLTEAVRETTQRLPCPERIRRAIPDEAHTIHRLLGASAVRPGHFRHGPHRPLALDLLIVDEASMVDLSLMTRLVTAVPPTAGLILLGDRHQLASVEAGAVLDDVCASDQHFGYSAACTAEVRAATGVDVPETRGRPSPAIRDCIVTLTRSHRFDSGSDIGRLAAAIRDGNAEDVEQLLVSPSHPTIARLDPFAGPGPTTSSAEIRDTLVAGFTSYLGAATPIARLRALTEFRILCAHHHGPDGVHGMNQSTEQALVDAGLLRTDGRFYEARPLLVTRNDYRVGLFNGDVGTIALAADPTVDDGGERGAKGPRDRLALFLSPNGTERWLSPGRLPPCDTAFAVSIHKSQGSELDRVLIMLPTRPSPVLSRELLYTAVSRARRQVTICGSIDVIREAVRTPVHRTSGLRDRLQQ